MRRYVLAVGCVGFLYTLIQLPFATYNAIQDKRLIRNGCLPEFDYYGDKVDTFYMRRLILIYSIVDTATTLACVHAYMLLIWSINYIKN